MPCYHPMTMFYFGRDSETHKAMMSPKRNGFGLRPYKEIIHVPCGTCLGCRWSKSKQWADRAMLELKDHDIAWYFTLTYDDDHVPHGLLPDPKTGEAIDCLSLRVRDMQLYHKRLRKHYGSDKIRMIYAGEYGDTTLRPHYHAIYYGLHIDDLQVYKRDRGYTYYVSPTIERIWGNGRVLIGEATWESVAYTARYAVKKAYMPMPEDLGTMEREFVHVSNRPGLGRTYYEDNRQKIYSEDRIVLANAHGARVAKPPKYYDNLEWLADPEGMALVSDKRHMRAVLAESVRLNQLQIDEVTYLRNLERSALDRVKRFARNQI